MKVKMTQYKDRGTFFSIQVTEMKRRNNLSRFLYQELRHRNKKLSTPNNITHLSQTLALNYLTSTKHSANAHFLFIVLALTINTEGINASNTNQTLFPCQSFWWALHSFYTPMSFIGCRSSLVLSLLKISSKCVSGDDTLLLLQCISKGCVCYPWGYSHNLRWRSVIYCLFMRQEKGWCVKKWDRKKNKTKRRAQAWCDADVFWFTSFYPKSYTWAKSFDVIKKKCISIIIILFIIFIIKKRKKRKYCTVFGKRTVLRWEQQVRDEMHPKKEIFIYQTILKSFIWYLIPGSWADACLARTEEKRKSC